MGGKGGSKNSTTVQSNEPPAYAIPYLADIATKANHMFTNDHGFNPYEGQTYAGMSDTTAGALDSLKQQASMEDWLSKASGMQALRVVGNQGLTGAQQQAGNILNAGANASALRADDRQFNEMYNSTPSSSVWDNLSGYAAGQGFSNYMGDSLGGATQGAWNPNAISQNLASTARGENIGANNQYLNQMLDFANQRAANALNANFSAAGRYGSGAHSSKVADAFSANEIGARQQALENDFNRMFQANQMLSGEQQQGFANRMSAIDRVGNEQNQNILQRMQAAQAVGNEALQNYNARLAALQGQTGVQGNNAQLSLNAANMLGNLGQQGAGNIAQFAGLAPTIYDQNFANERALMGAGQAEEQYAQGAMDDARANWDESQNEAWKRLEAYGGALGMAVRDYGTKVSVTQKGVKANPFF